MGLAATTSPILLKNGIRGFRNISETLSKHISLKIGERGEKKKKKIKYDMLPQYFRNFSVKYENRGELSNLGGASGNFLRKPGQAGRQPPPHFFLFKGHWRLRERPSTLETQESLKISEEKKKNEKNPSRGASVTLLRRFRERFCGSSLSFFIRSSFVLCRSSVFNW